MHDAARSAKHASKYNWTAQVLGGRVSHQIAYGNPWVLRVDGARRRLASFIALPIALAVILLAVIGGDRFYLATGQALANNAALDRLYLYLCIMAPFYAAAAALLVYERRSRAPANASPAVSGLGGLALGLAGFGLAVGLSALAGAITTGAAPAALDHRLTGMAIGALLIGFQAFGEELFFRGWLQPVLATRLGPWIGVLLTSALFAVAHAVNRKLGMAAFANDMLAGLVFGLLALRSGGLLAPFAAHFAWNWAEQCLLGLTPNPGVDSLGSLFDFDLVGPSLLGGGADELNGSILATVALAVMVGAVLLWRPERKPRAADAPEQVDSHI